jgi:hypothetical protein
MTPSGGPTTSSPTRLERAGALAARVSSLRPADPRVRRSLYAGIAIIVVLGIGLAAFTAAGDLPDVDWRFRPLAIFVAAASMAIALLATAEIWRRILLALGSEIPPTRARAIWFTSSLGRYVPTSLLLPMLRVAMCEREGAPKRVTLASVVYEFALFLTAGLFLGAYFVIDLPDLQDNPGRFLVLVLPIVAITCLQPRIFHNIADRVLARLGRAELPLSLSGARVLEFVGLYGLTYVLFGASLYALAECVHPVGAGDIVTVVGAFAVGTAISVIAFVLPGGLVAREAAIALALSPAMPAAPAVAVAVLVRILQLAIEVPLAVLTPLLARRAERR